jgi:hypothetical protein
VTYSPKRWKSLCPVVRTRSIRSGPKSMEDCSKMLREVGGLTFKVARYERVGQIVVASRYCAIDAGLRKPDAVNVNNDAVRALEP